MEDDGDEDVDAEDGDETCFNEGACRRVPLNLLAHLRYPDRTSLRCEVGCARRLGHIVQVDPRDPWISSVLVFGFELDSVLATAVPFVQPPLHAFVSITHCCSL